jgi:hypothetical protein
VVWTLHVPVGSGAKITGKLPVYKYRDSCFLST